MPDHLELTDQENRRTQKIIEFLSDNQSELVKQIHRTFMSFIYKNRFTLHPRRLGEISAEEVESFKSFLQSPDISKVAEHGKDRAREGLAERSLLSLHGIFRQFFAEKMTDRDHEILRTAFKSIDAYNSTYLLGYMKSRENQTLKDQEQLRRALSTALDRQRRELFIKNHAIHTYINGIMLTDLDGIITYVNPAFLKMWKCENAEDLLGGNSDRFWGNTGFGNIIKAVTNTSGWHSEFVADREDGSSFNLVVSASLIRDDADHSIGIMASFVDATEKKRLESQFRQAQKMDALGQLAGGIIHDFNNLLQVISGYTQLELMNASKSSKQYNNLMQIEIAAKRGKDLTEQLRYFTRQDTGQTRPLHLNDVVNETYNLLKRTFQPDITIRIMLDPHLRTIKADPSQMSQLLMNLCVNARDAMITTEMNIKSDSHNGTSDHTLILETYNFDLDGKRASQFLNARPGHYICVKVSDTGVGMAPDLIERLFEPFFTTKSENLGLGLGLALVYGIVRQHNGFIDVKSRLGQGSSFEIYFPMLEEGIEDSVSEQLGQDLTHGKRAILVVDDETQVRELAAATLEKEGYNVLLAADGADALPLYDARRNEIELVVLDVMMPKMGGWECFHRLREIDPVVKVLIMTGYTTDSSVQDFLTEGANGVIIKPFNLDTFTDSVAEVLQPQSSPK